MTIYFANIGFDLWPLGVLILIVFLAVQLGQKKDRSRLFCRALFGVYLLLALDKTFFPITFAGGLADALRRSPDWFATINLIPFHVYANYYSGLVITQFIQNVLLTIPFGFGLSFVVPVRRRVFFWLPLAVGFGIELAQLALSLLLGYPYRVVDITDALLNALGGWIGYGLYRAAAWLFLALFARETPAETGFFAYVYKIARQA